MITASIDIGTNTVLLLVAEIRDGTIRSVVEKQRVPRLGKGVDESKTLHPESMRRVLSVLNEYREFLEENYPEAVKNTMVTATSAVRDASNRLTFMDQVENETGWRIKLLSGTDEAETTYIGALSVLEDRSGKGNLILDIGGGSTELAFGRGYQLERAVSVDMGSVRFTERFFLSDPPDSMQIERARTEIRNLLKDQAKPATEFDLIGVAGTITSIAAIEIGLDTYEIEKLNGYVLTREVIESFIQKFSSLTSNRIEDTYPVFLKGRGEVILAGLLILIEVLAYYDKDIIITSTGGIRHGMMIKHSLNN